MYSAPDESDDQKVNPIIFIRVFNMTCQLCITIAFAKDYTKGHPQVWLLKLEGSSQSISFTIRNFIMEVCTHNFSKREVIFMEEG
jgi:hypothetical protein